MELPKKTASRADKVVDIAYEQERQQPGTDAPSLNEEISGELVKTQQRNSEMVRQINELERDHQRVKTATRTILTDKSQQIEQLQNEVSGLSAELRLKVSKISILEQEHQLALDRIDHLIRQKEVVSNSNSNSNDNASILHQLEGQITTNNVLKHHCNKLTTDNDELTQSLDVCRIELSNAMTNLEQQKIELHQVLNSHTEQVSVITQQRVVIERQEADLKRALDHYYDGVLNHDKKVSINLPD